MVAGGGGAHAASHANKKRETQTASEVAVSTKDALEGTGAQDIHNMDGHKRAEILFQVQEALSLDGDVVGNLFEIFSSADEDGSGEIDFDELRQLLESMGMHLTDQSFAEICAAVDQDGNGSVDFAEFVSIFAGSAGGEHAQMGAKLQKAIKTRNASTTMTVEQELACGVNTDDLVEFIEKELAEEQSCFQIPVAFAFMVSYYLVFASHSRMEVVHGVSEAIRNDLYENANYAFTESVPYELLRNGAKNIFNIYSNADFFSWVRLGVTPMVWPDIETYSEPEQTVLARCVHDEQKLQWFGFSKVATAIPTTGLPSYCANFQLPPPVAWEDRLYLSRLELVHAASIRQEQATAECSVNCQTKKWILEPELRDLLEDGTPPSWFWQARETGTVSEVLLPADLTGAAVAAELRRLELEEIWLNGDTFRVSLRLPLLWEDEGLFIVTTATVLFARGGQAWKRLGTIALHLDNFQDQWSYAYDAFFGIMCLQMIIREAKSLLKHWKEKKMNSYLSLWVVVEWVTAVFAGVMAYRFLRTTSMSVTLRTYLDAYRTKDPSFDGAGFQTFLRDFSLYTYDFQRIITWFPYLIAMRMFRAFDAQPRLSLVTRTMSTAASDVFHFFIVFLAVYFCFAMTGASLFGYEMQEFAGVRRANFPTCLRALLGDFDWDELKVVGRNEAAIWLVLFQVLIAILLLNMLVAIVLDTYLEVKGGMQDAETMGSQIYEIQRRYRQTRRKERVTLDHVLKHARVAQHNETSTALRASRKSLGRSTAADTVTAEILAGRVPGMKERQAVRLLTNTLEWKRGLEIQNMTMADNMLRTREIDSKVDRAMDSLRYLETITQLVCESQEDMKIRATGAGGSPQKSHPTPRSAEGPGSELDQVLVLQRKILAQQEDFFSRQHAMQQRVESLEQSLTKQAQANTSILLRLEKVASHDMSNGSNGSARFNGGQNGKTKPKEDAMLCLKPCSQPSGPGASR
jgi:hypothetical protein